MSAPAITTPATETVATFAMPRADWFGLLDDVAPFAADGRDGWAYPLLQVVQVVIEGKRITVRATDRYTIGRSWFETENEIGNLTALVPVKEIVAAKKLHVAHKRGLPQKELEISFRVVPFEPGKPLGSNPSVDTGSVTITSGGDFDARVTSVHKLHVGEYVSLDKLIPETFTDTGDIRWRPEFMDKFSRVRRDGQAIRVRFSGPTKPIRIDIGERFTGCVMPAPQPKDGQ